MIRSVKLAGLCGLLWIMSGGEAWAQAFLERPGVAAAPAGDFLLDSSSILPVDIGLGDINGPTDRFGMPLTSTMIKGEETEVSPINPERGTRTTNRQSSAKKPTHATKAHVAKSKDARKGTRAATNSGRTGPLYFVPHGSIDWTPGDPALSTSPSNPYGYGYGTSGYGTELFGDFWKGWPMVQ